MMGTLATLLAGKGIPTPEPLYWAEVAGDIENVTFQYFDGNGHPTLNPVEIRTLRVTVTARTKNADPKFKAGAGDGYRRRRATSTILLRNMGL